jgi:hypothetical protein
VAFGRVVGQTSGLSANDATVITLYNFLVQRLYKGKDPLPLGKTISVLRRGGTVRISQGVIHAVDASLPSFTVGTDYILFLRGLRGGGGYVSAQEELDFKAVSAGIDTRLDFLPGSGRTQLNFDSLSEFRHSLENSLTGCGAQ